ncbi:hypothetical protein [Ramlibacter sp. Leaf400]|uniref:hypothetical protein n=1 Tax=Ramlibacter sp. Leaf400 TaxID=1736365 RepID=UPI0007012153|nr:hypothetical protein [Ramlibacter sp. Leaf400]KQT11609.1 hypothetical protein ASG30_07010 [Ramlibacter sp. Leaf400]
MAEHLLDKLMRLDESRANLPGEHWLAFAAGVGLWVATRRHPSVAVRVLASVAGTLLVARAATGHEVPPLLARLPFARRPSRASDLIG